MYYVDDANGPAMSDLDYDEARDKAKRMSILLGFKKQLSRPQLLQDIESRGVVQDALPEVRNLFLTLEKGCSPLSLVNKVTKSMKYLRKFQEDLSRS